MAEQPSDGSGDSSDSSDDDSSSSDSSSDSSSSDDDSDTDEDSEARVGRPPLEFDFASELFEGSPHTVEQATSLLLRFRTRFRMSDAAMSAVFDVLAVLLPTGNNIMRFRQLVTLLEDGKLENVQTVHSCVNDCVLFCDAPPAMDPNLRRQFADLAACPKCNEPRMDQNGVPRKVRPTLVTVAPQSPFCCRCFA